MRALCDEKNKTRQISTVQCQHLLHSLLLALSKWWQGYYFGVNYSFNKVIILAFASWIKSKWVLVESWTGVMLRGLSKLHWDPESVTQSSWPPSLYMLCWALRESGIWVWSRTRFMLPPWWICFKPVQLLILSLCFFSRVIVLKQNDHVAQSLLW